jgi:hypothetical protein
MTQAAPSRTKINTEVTQAARSRSPRPPAGSRKAGRPLKGPRVSGGARESVRQPARPVIEVGFGILVYPPEAEGEPWRATFTENGQRRFRQGATEAKLAAKLAKVTERLQTDAVNMERPGADLIKHYLDPGFLAINDNVVDYDRQSTGITLARQPRSGQGFGLFIRRWPRPPCLRSREGRCRRGSTIPTGG